MPAFPVFLAIANLATAAAVGSPTVELGRYEMPASDVHPAQVRMCSVIGQGGDPVADFLDRTPTRSYIAAAALAIDAVDLMCPELGLPLDSLHDGTVWKLHREGWVGDPSDGMEALYPLG